MRGTRARGSPGPYTHEVRIWILSTPYRARYARPIFSAASLEMP
jgi:hypothetical protein